ncbi:glyoxylate/hydroxypyruvate reductase GhrA [Escherichia coli]|nr:glyoxylate/hydroxypyruvate reductase GhrA [Escherichia coli]
MLAGRDLKAVFALGAGVDSILSKLKAHPEMLEAFCSTFSAGRYRYGRANAGICCQSGVLHWFRRFDDYRIQQNSSHWQPLPEYHREDFTIGILGAGVLGSKVAQSLQTWRFPLRCWSRTRKSWPGVQSFAGREELSAFLSQCRVLINLLPNTPETVGIINQQLLEKLPDGAYLLNLARGVHVVEDDLLAALDSGKVKGAMLDVFNREPLPPESPLWQHPRVTITPHVAAITRPAEAVEYISRTIAQLEKGERVCGQVDRARGY